MSPVPLSSHPVWERQRRAYAEAGPEIFRSIPNAATNNPIFAAHLAGFLVDSGAPLDILEVGCGTGQFAYYFVRELFRRVGPDFHYRLYDLSPKTREFLHAHVCWRSWFDRGLVSVVDEPLPSPIVLGNYLLGSLAQERVRFYEGQWQRALVADEPFQVVQGEGWDLDPGPAPEGEYLYPIEAIQMLQLIQDLGIFSGKGHLELCGDVYSEAQHGEVSSRPTELEFVERSWPGKAHCLCDSSPLFSTLVLHRKNRLEGRIPSPVTLVRRWEAVQSAEQILEFLEEVQGFPQALYDLGRRLQGTPSDRALAMLRQSEQLHYPLWPGHTTHQRTLAKLFHYFGDPSSAERWNRDSL